MLVATASMVTPKVIAVPRRLTVNIMMMYFPWKPFVLIECRIIDSTLSIIPPSVLGQHGINGHKGVFSDDHCLSSSILYTFSLWDWVCAICAL